MNHSCGLAIIYRDTILLVHPTNALWTGSFSIPKGLVNDGETYIEAARRKTLEETGIDIPFNLIDDTEYIIKYRNRHTIYKQLHWFKVDITHTSFLGIYQYPILPRNQLQIEEIDWAGFLKKDDAVNRIFWRQTEILDIL